MVWGLGPAITAAAGGAAQTGFGALSGGGFSLGGLGSLAGGLSGLFGGGPSMRDPYAELYGANILQNVQDDISRTYSRAGSLAREKGEAGIQGAREARRSVDQTGRSSRRDILETGAQSGAAASQDMSRRGLGNTTAMQGAQRAVASDTSRNLSALDSALAGLYADLDLAEGQAEQMMYGDLANLAVQEQGAMASQYYDPYLSLFSFVPQTGRMSQYANLAAVPDYDFSGLGLALDDLFGG